MLDEGYVKIWRTILKWEWYKVEHTKTIFLHLIFTANLHDSKWRGITVKRGQRITSRNHLAVETGISEQQARTAIKHLISTNEITIQSTSEYSLITVVNFEDYQGNCKGATSQSTKRATIDQPTTNQPSTNDQPLIKNDKKDKKDKNDKNTNSTANAVAFTDGFAEFWGNYPKKKDKAAALRAWNKLKPDAELLAVILKAISEQKTTIEWTKERGQYIPYPASWLNGRRWEDEIDSAQKASYDMAEIKRSQAQDKIEYIPKQKPGETDEQYQERIKNKR